MKIGIVRPINFLEAFCKTPSYSNSIQPRQPVPTRTGFNVTDSTTPFVETRFDQLYSYYYSYQNSALYREYCAYADILLLKQGEEGFPSGLDISNLQLKLKKGRFALPVSLQEHGKSAFEMFTTLGRISIDPITGEYEINESIRFCDWPNTTDSISVQIADYKDQLATNITLDWASGKIEDNNASIRSLFEPPVNGKLPLLKKSILANTLGVAIVIMTSDEKLILPIRGTKEAVINDGKGKFHCSSSGVFKLKHLKLEQLEGDTIPFEYLLAGMQDEIYTELNLPASTYRIIPLALARELSRGGKPQLFCGGYCDLTYSEVQELMKNAIESWEFIDPSQLSTDSELFTHLEQPEKISRDKKSIEKFFTYEGWMALRLFELNHNHQTLFENEEDNP